MGLFGNITFDWAFFSALFSIVIIDLILAGDNAVVIAMAVRSLPNAQRGKGILWGASAAVLLFELGLSIPFVVLTSNLRPKRFRFPAPATSGSCPESRGNAGFQHAQHGVQRHPAPAPSCGAERHADPAALAPVPVDHVRFQLGGCQSSFLYRLCKNTSSPLERGARGDFRRTAEKSPSIPLFQRGSLFIVRGDVL